MKNNKLVDYVKVSLPEGSFKDATTGELPKALKVTFLLSSAGKRTNGRIYTPAGQMRALDSWTKPYKKPIQIQHDDSAEKTIGRFSSVRYVEHDGIQDFFPSQSDYAWFRDQMMSDNPKQIVKALKKYKLLDNPKWPGIGSLLGEARITDKDAIEKFIDERYLTFSAGSHSDRYVCGECEKDWMNDSICEHSPRQRDEDGDPITFVTGTFYGDEASVVGTPANSNSRVLALEFSDAADNELLLDKVDQPDIQTCVATVDLDEEIVEQVQDAVAEAAEVVAEAVVESTAVDVDALVKLAVEQALEDFKAKQMDQEIDWFLLDAGLRIEMGDEALTAEQRAELKESSFCGPDRSFPVPDCAHVTAARRLLNRAKLSESQKTKVLACVNKKAENMSCDASVDVKELVDLKKDYKAALIQIDNLKVQIEQLEKELSDLKKSKLELDTQNDIEQNVDSQTYRMPAAVENPSIAGHGDGIKQNDSKLNAFEKDVVDRFRRLKVSKGKSFADQFLMSQVRKGYLPKNFDIKTYIQENE